MSTNENKNQKPQKLDWSPKLESFTTLSKARRFVIHRTVITTIKPRRYIEKVLEGEVSSSSPSEDGANAAKVESAGN